MTTTGRILSATGSGSFQKGFHSGSGIGSSRPSSPLPRVSQDHSGRSEAPRERGFSLEAWSRGLLGDVQLESVGQVAEWVRTATAVRSSASDDADAGIPKQGGSSKNTDNGDHSSSQLSFPQDPITSSGALLPWLESLKEFPTAAAASSKEARSTSIQPSPHDDALQAIKEASEQTTLLLDQLENARINVAELKAGSRSIEETSEELRDESEERGGKTESLLRLTADVDGILSYYSLLPSATSFLSEPNLARVVLSDRFSYTLAQCDVALTFVREHPHFKDAAIYRLRFEHCITRGGSLAKLWVCGKFKELGSDAAARLKERDRHLKERRASLGDADLQPTPESAFLLDFASSDLLGILYPKFAAAAPELRSVLADIIKRCPHAQKSSRNRTKHKSTQMAVDNDSPLDEESMLADYSRELDGAEHDVQGSVDQDEPPEDQESYDEDVNTFAEFETLLSDCRTAFFEARKALLQPLIAAMLSRLERQASSNSRPNPDTSDATSGTSLGGPLQLFLSQALSLLRSIMISEYSLYQDIFGDARALATAAMPGSSSSLADYLKALGSNLFDRVHPKIYAETRIVSLSRLARVILESVTDLDDTKSSSSNTQQDGYLLYSRANPFDFAQGLQRTRLESDEDRSIALLRPLILPLHSDVTSRLTFRTRAVLNGRDIAGYASSADEMLALIGKMSKGARAEMLGLSVSSDQPNAKRRGRSSVGVGVLEAAAKRALEEAASTGTVAESGSKTGAGQEGKIELFAIPPASSLATWYPSFVRILKILSALHPVLQRNDFATLGIEALGCGRTSLLKAADMLPKLASVNEVVEEQVSSEKASRSSIDSLDSALFVLRHSLLLKEMSSSIDLSLVQPSLADALDGQLRSSAQIPAQSSSALDAGVVMKVMSGIIEAVQDAGKALTRTAPSADDKTVNGSGDSVSAGANLNLAQHVSQASAAVIRTICDLCLRPVLDDDTLSALSSPLPRLEESLLPPLRRSRRRVALYIEDDEVVTSVLAGVLEHLQAKLVAGPSRDPKDSNSPPFALRREQAYELAQNIASKMALQVTLNSPD